jgi:hypothetical protein
MDRVSNTILAIVSKHQAADWLSANAEFEE